ncbi:MAG: MFS transporter [Spirochaetes bacterium]|uniref:MFS transporter n=1 Tax=Candidatus Ornithospirochaeta stercoripullorum TaxID=2840899 RepID=A0A9D9H602_9SPIO|nr:MFS transporter [Candidatus Ornithospirochaeta stercoripullorum]
MKDERKFSNFILLWATQTLSRLGSSLTPFALILWAYGETGSALSTALLTVSSYVPYILLSLPVGTLTDRMNKKNLMLVSDTTAALCTLSILFVWLSGNLELWHLYLVNCITGTAQTFQQPASEVATTLVTPEDKYQKAGSLNALASSVINIASPVIATTLYSTGGLTLVIIVDLSTFTVAFISLLLLVKIPEMEKKERKESHIILDLKEALGFLKANIGILQVILFLAAINFIASIYNAALPAMILSFESESVLAAVQSTAGAAMIAGSVIAAIMPTPKSRVRMIIISLFISMSTENFMLAFFRNPGIWCAGAFLGWLFIPVMNTNLDALMRSLIPSVIQGRVYSARNMLQFFTIPLGYLAGGFLADTVFEPFMADKSGTFLNQLFGTGKGSGTAFLFAVIGIMGVLVCVIFSKLEAMRRLDG